MTLTIPSEQCQALIERVCQGAIAGPADVSFMLSRGYAGARSLAVSLWKNGAVAESESASIDDPTALARIRKSVERWHNLERGWTICGTCHEVFNPRPKGALGVPLHECDSCRAELDNYRREEAEDRDDDSGFHQEWED